MGTGVARSVIEQDDGTSDLLLQRLFDPKMVQHEEQNKYRVSNSNLPLTSVTNTMGIRDVFYY